MLKALFQAKGFIGLDIEANVLRLILLRKQQDQFIVNNVFEIESAETLLIENKITDWRQLTALLAGLVKQECLGKYPVAISIPAVLTQTNKLRLPSGLRSEDVVKQIWLQIEREFAVTEKDVYMDYVSIDQQKTSHVHYTVTHKPYLLDYIKAIDHVGLKVKVVDIDIYALQRAMIFALPLGYSTDNYALLHSTAERTIIIICVGDRILWWHQFLTTPDIKFSAYIKNQINIFCSKQRLTLRKILFSHLSFECDDLSTEFELVAVNPFANILIDTNLTRLKTNEHLFISALGLALRGGA